MVLCIQDENDIPKRIKTSQCQTKKWKAKKKKNTRNLFASVSPCRNRFKDSYATK